MAVSQEAEAWLQLLLELLPLVGPLQLLEQVLPLAMSHGQVGGVVFELPHPPPLVLSGCYSVVLQWQVGT